AKCPCTPGKPAAGCCCVPAPVCAPLPAAEAVPPPAMMPPPPPVGLAPPMPCQPVAVMVPMPVMPPMPYPAPVPLEHSYVVDLKVVERKPDADEKVVARPQMHLSEHCIAHVAYGRPDLCSCGDGEEKAGKLSDHLDVRVLPLKPGCVRLEVALVQKESDD